MCAELVYVALHFPPSFRFPYKNNSSKSRSSSGGGANWRSMHVMVMVYVYRVGSMAGGGERGREVTYSRLTRPCARVRVEIRGC